ncbi:hypothetical protein [Nocardia sp. CC227C]|uniref:hypothetical protein n=1 Tax=Nocardia sp. CC227C TaxID=3044562 RepID=UPI00278C0E94|nr:hypothetical protein [Nocardia sp. CC227C]
MSIRLGPRDWWGMQWLSQMGGAPIDVLADLLAQWPLRPSRSAKPNSEENAYRVAQRWRAAGKLVEERHRPVPGPEWVVPNADTASPLLGFPVPEWVPSPMMAAHTTAAARLRLHLAKGQRSDTWVSERVLRHRNGFRTRPGEPMPHLHDGLWTDDLGHLCAIEVELTRKGSSEARATMQAAYDAAEEIGAQQLIYYCGSDEVRSRVRAAAADLTTTPSGPQVISRPAAHIFDPSASAVDPGADVVAAGGAAS